MKYQKIKFAFLLLFLNLTTIAQEAFTVTGGDILNDGGTVNYSIGLVLYTTNNGTNGLLAQGVQQPYEITVVSGIEDDFKKKLSCMVFPNPTTDYLTLKVETHDNAYMLYQLFDFNGKLLEGGGIEGNETNIKMTNYLPATYFLKVYVRDTKNTSVLVPGNNEVHNIKFNKVDTKQYEIIKTFKIIKN